MEHAVLGLGAIGGLVATSLSAIREEVTAIVRSGKLATFPGDLSLQRPAGFESLTGHTKLVSALDEPVDVLWITTKTYQLQSALEVVTTSPRSVIPLLNGTDHIAILRERFGKDRVIAATIAVEAESNGPGKYIQRSPFIRLNLSEHARPMLSGIVESLTKIGFSCQFIQNEQTLLWNKLCFLAPFALATSASGKNVGEVLADAEWNHKLKATIEEACAVAQAIGAETQAEQIQSFFEGVPPAMRSSMQKDLAAGRMLELDGIGGPIVRGGERFKIATPATSALMASILSKSTS